jgi:hypothetical protein
VSPCLRVHLSIRKTTKTDPKGRVGMPQGRTSEHSHRYKVGTDPAINN